MKNVWQKAFRDHRLLFGFVALYCIAVLAEAVYCKVPPGNLAHIFGYIFMSAMVGFVFLSCLYVAAFVRFFACGEGAFLPRWKAASARLDLVSRAYFESGRWPYAFFAFFCTLGDCFFFIAKSLINTVNPYVEAAWDKTFAAWDNALHFGMYPHEFIIPAVNALGAGRVLDFFYAFWLVVMLLVACYNVFADDLVHRRLRYLWTHFLSWVFLGTIGATVFSSVGPLFYNDFFPDGGDIYAPLRQNLEGLSASSFVFAAETRELLLVWSHNDRIFDPNALSAMPSMHLAIGWLMVLYARQGARWVFAVACVFFALVYLGSVYFGFHYAVDAYVSVAFVSLVWWLAGKMLDKRHARNERLSEMPHAG